VTERKPIFIVRMAKNGLTVTGQLQIKTGPYFATAEARRQRVAEFVAQLRELGLEITPKQPEAHR
jgi:hypothetical protein